jgi:hypothetical protein
MGMRVLLVWMFLSSLAFAAEQPTPWLTIHESAQGFLFKVVLRVARSTASMEPRRMRLSQMASSRPVGSMMLPRALTALSRRVWRL